MAKLLAACFWQADFWYITSKHYLYRVVLYSSMTSMGGRIVCRTDISTYYTQRGERQYIQRREQQHSPAVVSYYTHIIEGKKQDAAEYLCCTWYVRLSVQTHFRYYATRLQPGTGAGTLLVCTVSERNRTRHTRKTQTKYSRCTTTLYRYTTHRAKRF